MNEILESLDMNTSFVDEIKTENAKDYVDQNKQFYDSQYSKRDAQLFDIHDFAEDLNRISQMKNFNFITNSENINGYDIASNCIRQTIFRILKYPVASFQDAWLPVILRAILGNAVHSFIQNNYTGFTEKEVSLKIPSIRCSTRLDALMNDNVIVEIKSCPYTDYDQVIKKRKPRDADFYQVLFYKILLEEFLDEAKNQDIKKLRSLPPNLDKYKIRFLQLIYVAHDIDIAEASSLSNAVNKCRQIRKMLNSKLNPLSFITCITIDTDEIDIVPYENYIREKVNTINWYLNNKKIPPMNDKFIDKSSCFFCLFKDICKKC